MATAFNPPHFSAVFLAPFGAVGIRTAATTLQEIVYLPSGHDEIAPTDAIAEQTCEQIARYVGDPDFRFSIPLATVGTAFQQRVWQTISSVERGKVLTYGAVAKQLCSAPRAVGQACGSNWFPLVIPCHRVVGLKGIGGFAHSDDATGFQLKVKRWLLSHEGVALA